MNFPSRSLALLLLLPAAVSRAVDAEGVTENKAATHALKPYDRKPDTTPQDSAPAAARSFAKARIPAGFKAGLWASEPLMANPVAFSFDGQGRMYIAETHRYRTSVLDIRHYMFMLEDDLANRNQDDWVKSIKKNFPNDWQDLGKESEVVRLVEDTNGDGTADKTSVYADGFNSILDGIASGVLARPDGVWLTNIPGLYKLSGKGDDGKAAKKEEVFRGFGIRFNYTGHDLHGLIKGPDGRLYFSIGDRGTSVKTKEGTMLEVPDEGAIFRCEEDGSHLELVMRGLRNPQELAFDDYGNLFTCDNDSDQGDRERLVYVVEGGDAGWRIGYQHCPQPAERNPWLAEHMWEPRDPAKNQPASILSPIANLPDGPGGLVHYPGTGLPDKYNGCFFLACYKGNTATSQVAVFKPVPDGAGFKLEMLETFIPGCQATDVDFGPDSRLYVSFWDEGWERTAQGRIMKVEHEEARKAQAAQIAEVQKLLGEGMKQRSAEELVKLLGHKDQRVRLEAQWELASKGVDKEKEAVTAELTKIMQESGNKLQRLHAIWAFGQILRTLETRQLQNTGGLEAFSQKPSPFQLVDLHADPDEEVRCAWLRVVADQPSYFGEDKVRHMIELLNGSSARVRLAAALALGKKGDSDALGALIRIARDGQQLSQEMTCVVSGSLARILVNYQDPIGTLQFAGTNPDLRIPIPPNSGVSPPLPTVRDQAPAVRKIMLLTAGKMARELLTGGTGAKEAGVAVAEVIAEFLKDEEPLLVREAARLLNDLGCEADLSVSATLPRNTFDNLGAYFEGIKDPLTVLRIFNSWFRAGGQANADRLVMAIGKPEARPSPSLCAEALAMLAQWDKPAARDRVSGLFRPVKNSSTREQAIAALSAVPRDLIESDPTVTLQTIETVRALQAPDWSDYLVELSLRANAGAVVRSRALHVLADLNSPLLAATLQKAIADPSSTVRITAAGLLGKTDPESAAKALESALAQGTPEDARAAFTELAALSGAEADRIVAEQLAVLAEGKVPAVARLELLEAAAKREAQGVKDALAKHQAAQPKDDPLARFDAVLEGGNAENGKKLFKEHAVAACQRCHMVNKSGGEAGPALDGIAAKRDRRYLLESIVNPSAQFAEGFRMMVCTMKDGTIKAGAIKAETADSLTLQNLNEDPVTLRMQDIAQQDQAPSGMMPGLGELLTPRELRDIIEYCATLK